MRLPVYTYHQVVINASQFTFRENNEACVYLLPTGSQQHELWETRQFKIIWLDKGGKDSSLKKSLSLLFYGQSKSFVQSLETKTKFMKLAIVL